MAETAEPTDCVKLPRRAVTLGGLAWVGGLLAAGGGGCNTSSPARPGGGAGGAAEKGLRYRGVSYETGLTTGPGEPVSQPLWGRDLVRGDVLAIRERLHCNSITVFGSEIARLVETSREALGQGLTVMVQPRLYDHPQEQILDHLARTAREIEGLRRQYGDRVYLVVGCEYTLFTPGIAPGGRFAERIQKFGGLAAGAWPPIFERFDAFLRKAARVARANFGGAITYGATTFEPVDWALFDVVGLDYYEFFASPDEYHRDFEKYRRWQKPILILEFGCCTYPGAPERGGSGYDIIDYGQQPPRIVGDAVRSERVQADHVARMMNVFEAEGLLGAHVYTFYAPDAPHSAQRETDLDMGAFSLVKVIRENLNDSASAYRWEPKESFHALARHNGGRQRLQR